MADPNSTIEDGQPGAPGDSEHAAHGLRGRADALAARGHEGLARLESERPRHASIEVGFRWVVRDKQIAGGVLGGGLAYRLFFWALALTVLVTGGLGLASSSGLSIASGLHKSGLSSAFASSVSTAAGESGSGRWYLLLLGAYFTLWFSWGLLRALRLVHCAAWQVAPPPLRHGLTALAAVLAAPVVMVVLSGIGTFTRDHTSGVPGLAATLVAPLAFGLVALLASIKLPSRDVPWTAFIPGAVALTIGVGALDLFTVYYLTSKLEHASAVYGTLGIASTTLFYLFLVGRGVVWAAELNAVVWEVKHPESVDPEARPVIPQV